MTGYIILRIIATLMIPVFVRLYISKAQELTTTPVWNRWVFKNPFTYLSVIACGTMIGLEYQSQLDSQPELEKLELIFFTNEKFKEEIKKFKSIEFKEGTDLYKQILMKFEYAEYSRKKNDYEITLNTLEELVQGKDHHGTFPKVESYVLKNNIGVAFFELQRNKDFKSSINFINSLELIQPVNPDYEVVQKNIINLNQMVNKLD